MQSGKSAVQIFEEQVSQMGEEVFISFDLDSVSGADAPVSSKR